MVVLPRLGSVKVLPKFPRKQILTRQALQLAKKSNSLDGEFSQFDLRDDYGLEC